MAKSSSSSTGCVGLVVILFLIGIALYAVAVVLMVLGVGLMIAAPVVTVGTAIWAWAKVVQHRRTKASLAELSVLASGACADLSDLLLDIDYLEVTRAIGTGIEPSRLPSLRRDAHTRIQLLDAASSPGQLIEAVLEAETFRLRNAEIAGTYRRR